MLSEIQSLGFRTINLLRNLGVLSIFIDKAILSFTKRLYYFWLILRQFIVIGYYSLKVVVMTAFFRGSTWLYKALQASLAFRQRVQLSLWLHTFDHKWARSFSCRFNGSRSCWRFNCCRNCYNASNWTN